MFNIKMVDEQYIEGWNDCLNKVRESLEQAAEQGSLEGIGMDIRVAAAVEKLINKEVDNLRN